MIHSLSHLSDQVLLRDLATLVGRDRTTTAELLAHLAEVDARRLYAPAGYSSMYAYCVDNLHLSEDAAYKRIQAARAARQFPVLFTALAQGRLHLAAVCLLAPRLNAGNVDELIAASEHQRKSEIERLLAERFPRAELMGLVSAVPANPVPANRQLAPGQVDGEAGRSGSTGAQPAPGQVDGEAGRSGSTGAPLAPGQVEGEAGRSGSTGAQLAPGQVVHPESAPTFKLTPSAPERFHLEMTIGKGTHDNLLYAQALLSHSIPSGDLAQVFDRALTALIRELEKRKLGTGRKPRPRRRSGASGRYVSKRVRRAVWERDQGQCTFVSETGHRCRERRFLQFDHIDPVARGGRATVERMRLRCHAHNQYDAEQAFGADFMRRKREQPRVEQPSGTA